MRNYRDPYEPIYCTRCHRLQFHNFIGRPCQFCGNLEFRQLRPAPTLTQIDRRVLKELQDKERT